MENNSYLWKKVNSFFKMMIINKLFKIINKNSKNNLNQNHKYKTNKSNNFIIKNNLFYYNSLIIKIK